MRDKQVYNEYQRTYQLNRIRQRRQEALDQLGGKCVVCGVVNNSLEFDHIDPATKLHTIANIWTYSHEVFWTEVEKCQLLCKPHHKQKTGIEDAKRRPITHGKYWAAYKMKCECGECMNYKIEYARKRRVRRANIMPL